MVVTPVIYSNKLRQTQALLEKKSMSFISAETLLPSSLSAADHARAGQVLEQIKIGMGHQLEWTSIFQSLAWPRNSAIICDNNTWEALAKNLSQCLSSSGYRITLLNVGSTPKPTDRLVDYLAENAASCDGLIAVGSGVINDLTQFTAHRLQKPYIICGTAASMNGYLSANAAIMIAGHKKSLPAALPTAALFDLDVLEKAPIRLKQAGLGDSICRSTAQADWLLSHHLLDTPYDSLPFALLAPYEEAMLTGNMEALMMTLLLSGLGMTLAGGSYPASQGEHLLSHYMEMRLPDIAHEWLHGEQIAATTMLMANMQENLLRHPLMLKRAMPDESEVMVHFGEEVGMQVWQEWQAKQERIGDSHAFDAKIRRLWPIISEEIIAIRLPAETLQSALEKQAAPTDLAHLGLTQPQVLEMLHFAPLIRNRFTFLDVDF